MMSVSILAPRFPFSQRLFGLPAFGGILKDWEDILWTDMGRGSPRHPTRGRKPLPKTDSDPSGHRCSVRLKIFLSLWKNRDFNDFY